MVDNKASTEVTADIELSIDDETYTIQSLEITKEIENAEIRGNNIKKESNPTTAMDYTGSMTFHGNKKTEMDNVLFDENDLPKYFDITITHTNDNDASSGLQDVKVTSEGYTADEGENTETTYDIEALDEL